MAWSGVDVIASCEEAVGSGGTCPAMPIPCVPTGVRSVFASDPALAQRTLSKSRIEPVCMPLLIVECLRLRRGESHVGHRRTLLPKLAIRYVHSIKTHYSIIESLKDS